MRCADDKNGKVIKSMDYTNNLYVDLHVYMQVDVQVVCKCKHVWRVANELSKDTHESDLCVLLHKLVSHHVSPHFCSPIPRLFQVWYNSKIEFGSPTLALINEGRTNFAKNQFTFRFAHATISTGGRKRCCLDADKRGVIHKVFPQKRDTNLQHFPRKKIK